MSKNLYTKPESQDADVQVVKELIKENYENGVVVNFLKKDNTLRKMFVKLNPDVLKAKDENDPKTEARRETNRANFNMVVSEFLEESNTYQVRTIPLKKVVSVDLP